MNTADDITETAEEASKASKWNAMKEKRQSRTRPPDNSKTRKGANVREEQSNEQQSEKPDILDLFAKDELMEGCIPLFLSKATQQVFNVVADENVTKLKPSALIPKSEILRDIQLRASVSDFSVHKTIINDYNGLEILVIYDADMKFGENFVLVTNEEAKNHILNPIEDQMDQQSGDEDSNAELEEASDSVTFFRPTVRRPWISLGSDKEVLESSIIETRPKVYTIFQRPRREFGAPVTLSDRDATDKGASSLVTAIPEKANDIPIMEVDKSVSNAQLTSERGTNTDWKYPRNAFTQYTPRVFTAEELQTIYAPGGPLQDIGKHFPTLKQGLLQNMMYDFLASDFENLAAGDETYDTRADNTFKEFLSFTDLKFSKDKAVTDIQWHPTIKGIVGMSVGERIDYDHRADQCSRILLTSTHIILWSFADPIQPQLLLEAPEDILCFQFNPTDPNIVAGGCFNGMVVLWDIEKHMEDLRKVKARMKAKNKAPLFSFDDTDPNRVPVSPYCAVSNIESSHTSPILDLKWVPDHVEINRLGYCLENVSLKCVQLQIIRR